MMNVPGNPVTAVFRDRAAPLPPGASTNTYCATCLRTRRFHDRATHLACETCSRRLDKVVPARRTAG